MNALQSSPVEMDCSVDATTIRRPFIKRTRGTGIGPPNCGRLPSGFADSSARSASCSEIDRIGAEEGGVPGCVIDIDDLREAGFDEFTDFDDLRDDGFDANRADSVA